MRVGRNTRWRYIGDCGVRGIVRYGVRILDGMIFEREKLGPMENKMLFSYRSKRCRNAIYSGLSPFEKALLLNGCDFYGGNALREMGRRACSFGCPTISRKSQIMRNGAAFLAVSGV